MRPVALVIPWFGKELKGGAEQLAWQVAHRLAHRGHAVEILTTCCRAFLEDWNFNHLRPGKSVEDNVTVRRFKVSPRRADMFNAANSHLLALPRKKLQPGVDGFGLGTGDIFVQENINSQTLLKYIRKNREKYQAFVFLPYLYGPILNGVEAAGDKAFLQPCLHDEAYAYLTQVDHIFRCAAKVLYNSAGEKKLAEKLYGPGIISKGVFVGVGIEPLNISKSDLPARVGNFELESAPYILCLGRRDPHKNTDFIVKAFNSYKRHYPQSPMRLILAGPGNCAYTGRAPDLFDLGLVAENEKEALLAGCAALFHPSENESYSRVVMEAWFHQKPVVVHRDCLATATAVGAAHGGWVAGDTAQWVAAMESVAELNNADSRAIALNGFRYAKEYADWERVIDRYEIVLGLQAESGASINQRADKKKGLRAIHQMTPGFAYGDAISNQALIIRDYLREKGYRSDIYAESIDPAMESQGVIFTPELLSDTCGLIYHHSIGSNITRYAHDHPGPKCLIYHNITPPEFVRENDPKLANQLEQGLKDLTQLSQSYKYSVGDSRYNADALGAHGFRHPGVLSICVDPQKWDHTPDPAVMARMQDGKINWLFVGRIIPNKCQDDLIKAFDHYVKMDPRARLVIVGGYSPEDPYLRHILKMINDRRLRSKVVVTGKVSDAELQAYYRTAHLYCSMSEHEGFGVPLIEAMWFDVPVLAYKSSAVTETMGCGGLLFSSKDDLVGIAATARMMIHDTGLNRRVISGQRVRRQDFLPEKVGPEINKMVAYMESSS